jgi:hypothetical protein
MARRSGLALVALALLGGPLAAQNPVELGIDGGFTFRLNDPSGVVAQFPTGHFRVAFPAGSKLAVEPRFSFNYIKFSGVDAVYTMTADLGLMFHFKSAGAGSRPYLRPFAGIDLIGGGGSTDSQFHLGAGIGVKLPMKTDRMALRLEGGLSKGLEDGGTTGVFALIGLSFFTR